MKFSVLMSVYYKDNPSELQVALESIWDKQTLKPDEIVIVKDGPLTDGLDVVLTDFASRAPVRFVALEKNSGLGIALGQGLEACLYELVGRMDSDDISLPERFEKQIGFMDAHPEIAIIGSAIDEFEGSPENVYARRVLPCDNEAIKKFARSRCPFNHMSVVFRKSAVLDVGNYCDFKSYEDYYLWMRIIVAGYKCANLEESLLLVRAGQGMLSRRRGWRFFCAELKLARKLHECGLISYPFMLRNMLLRAPLRLFPELALKMIYRLLRTK